MVSSMISEEATGSWVSRMFGVQPPDEHYLSWNLSLAGLYIFALVLLYKFFYSGKSGGFRHFIKGWLLKLTILGGIIIYSIGYHLNEPELNIGVIVLLALFSTARLFILGNDLVEIHHHNGIFLIWFSVFSVSAALISTSVLINFIGKSFLSWLRMVFNFSKQNYVFLGLNTAGITLAKDILSKNKSPFIVFIQDVSSTDDKTLVQHITALGAIVISTNTVSNFFNLQHEELIFQPNGGHDALHSHTQDLNLKKLFLSWKLKHRRSDLFILSDNESENFHLLSVLLKNLESLKVKTELKIHLRTVSPNASEVYKSVIAKASERLVLHDQAQIVARQLVNDNLPIIWIKENYPNHISKDATVSRDFTVMIIGFGLNGNSVFRKFYEQGQFVGSRFNAIVIDRDLKRLKGDFINRYSGLVAELGNNLKFYDEEVGSLGFYEILKDYSAKVDYIVISLGNDDLSLKTAFDVKYFMSRYQRPYKIFTQISRNNIFLNVSDENIKVFGRDSDVFTEEIITRESYYSLAKSVHAAYDKEVFESKRKAWEQLSNFTQESNISVVEHSLTKLILAGLYSAEGDDTNDENGDKREKITTTALRNKLLERLCSFTSYDQFQATIGSEAIKNIAITEHLRWNAFHFINGWVRWELSDIPTGSRNKDELRKLHACLVSWDELDAVMARFGEDYKSYDEACLKEIYENAIGGHYSIKGKDE